MTKARTNASASPAVGRNIIQNGAMNVAQRSASVTGLGASAGYFTCDRWKLNFAGSTAGRLTMSQTSDGPNGISANCIKLDCTTADTSIAAGEFAILQQLIEGQNLQRLGKGVAGAKQITVSFYVKGSRASTQVCNLYEGDNNRHIGATFSVTTDWTRVEITFPADEDDGSSPLADDNTVSIYFQIWLHAGSNYTGGTIQTTWANYVANTTAAGLDSLFSSTDNNLFVTGVQMEVGPVATEFEQEDISTTLQKCQRYFETGKAGATGNHPTADTGFFGGVVHYKVDKRAAATLAQSGQSYRELENDTIYLGSVGQQYALNVVNGFAHDAIHDGANCKYIFTYTADAEL